MGHWAWNKPPHELCLLMVWIIHGTRNISYIYVTNIAIGPRRGKHVWIMTGHKTAHPFLTITEIFFLNRRKSLCLFYTYYSMPRILPIFHKSSEIFMLLICFPRAIITYSIKTHFSSFIYFEVYLSITVSLWVRIRVSL